MAKNKPANKQVKNTSLRSKPKPPAQAPLRPDNVSLFIEKHAFLISLSLLMLIGLTVYCDFLFFKKVFLFKDIGSDTVNIGYPPMKHVADYIHTIGIPKWSFNYGMGQNIFPFFLQRDPFDIILFLIGKDNLVYGIGYIEYIKVVTGGIIFFLYLRTLSLNAFTCIVGSILFAFSGFMILGGTWFVFSFEAISAALLLLAFEKLFRQNSWILFPIVIALICISMPFNLYVYGLFLAVYAVFRFVAEKGWNTKDFFVLFGKMMALGLLGMAISSFFMFSNVLQLIESPRGSGDTSYFTTLASQPMFSLAGAQHNITAIMRLFSSDSMGTGINFKGWQNYLEAPMFYCGLLSLLLFPAIFQYLDKRRKIIYSIFLAFWLLPVLFPYFRYAFWLFTGDYYRAFSLVVSFTFLFLGLQALNKIIQTNKINAFVLFGTLIVLLGVLSYNFSDDLGSGVFNKNVLSFARVFLVIYAVLIYLLSKEKIRGTILVFLLLTLCVEVAYFSNITVNKRSIISKEEFNSKEGYNDYSVDAIAYIKEHDKSFYRIDKYYSSGPAIHQSINDGLVQDYRGTSSYNSFNQMYYILFLQAIGLVHKGNEIEARWAGGLASQPIAESIGNVKYVLTKQGYNLMADDSIAQFGDVKVLKNKRYLPLGFTYDKYTLRSNFDSISNQQKIFMMMKAFFVNDKEKSDYKDFGLLTAKDSVRDYNFDSWSNDVQALKQDTLAISDFGQNFIHGKINLNKKKLLFLSIPYDKGWTAKVDGVKQEIKIVDAGMCGLMLDKGMHTVDLEFFPRLYNEGLFVSLISLLLFGVLIWMSERKKLKSKSPELSDGTGK